MPAAAPPRYFTLTLTRYLPLPLPLYLTITLTSTHNLALTLICLPDELVPHPLYDRLLYLAS